MISNKISYRSPSSSRAHSAGDAGNNRIENEGGNYQGQNREKISLLRVSVSPCDERVAAFPLVVERASSFQNEFPPKTACGFTQIDQTREAAGW
jgi:hypothetical protein